MRSPLVTAHGVIDSRDGLLVGSTRDGMTGWGEVSPLPGFGTETDLDWIEVSIAAGGNHPALEWAHADLEARLAGRRLAEILTPNPVGPIVAVNATIGDLPVEATVERCRQIVDEGYGAVKMKVGAGTVERDLERAEAARTTLGERIELRLDANQGWDIESAHRALDGLSQLGISYLEEPTSDASDIDQLSDYGIALALDESLTGDSVLELIATTAAAVVIIKPAVVGGPATTLELIGFAEAAGKRIIITSFFDGPVGLATAANIAATLPDHGPHGVATAALVMADYPAALMPEGGTVSLPGGPGIGIDPV